MCPMTWQAAMSARKRAGNTEGTFSVLRCLVEGKIAHRRGQRPAGRSVGEAEPERRGDQHQEQHLQQATDWGPHRDKPKEGTQQVTVGARDPLQHCGATAKSGAHDWSRSTSICRQVSNLQHDGAQPTIKLVLTARRICAQQSHGFPSADWLQLWDASGNRAEPC